MIGSIKSKLKLKVNFKYEGEYGVCVKDLIQNEIVRSMEEYIQHSNVTCLKHSMYVSYYSYLVCRFLRFDYWSAARGGLLHDLFLYDWHIIKPANGLHGFVHPRIALENARKHFLLNRIEKDIIEKHMWPLTFKFPRYKETFVVLIVDKYCAFMEIIKFTDCE
jgi:uncharacterized protein